MKACSSSRLFPRHAIATGIAALLTLITIPVIAAPTLIAIGSLNNSTDLSTATNQLESGIVYNNTLGGIGSGLAWAGGNTFLATPDRGPNATAYNGGAAIDNTTSYIARFDTLKLTLTQTPSHPSVSNVLPFTLTPVLQNTTLLYSPTALIYGPATPSANAVGKYYFDGRSDNFGAGVSTNPDFARLDPEAIRVSRDGNSVFIADEYGPYVYQFDRATGARIKSFALPSYYAIPNLSSTGATEISSNTIGRVTNKGMEGLAITPDGTTLVGFMQSPLIQDGGDGGRANRIITIDIATGTTHQYVYDNYLADSNKTYNSSEILAINSHEFLVLERDGKGLGDGSNAAVKRLYKFDLSGATDISGLSLGGSPISGESNLLPLAVTKSLFLDIKLSLNIAGVSNANIPAKLEGAAFGEDITFGGINTHTLYISNDNDFVPGIAGPNNFYVFGFTDADLNGSILEQQIVPEPATALTGVMLLLCSGGSLVGRRFRRA